METNLNKIMVMPCKKGLPLEMTAADWLMTQPEAWRAIETEAIYECMKKGWELHVMNIQSTAREIDAKRNPKGW